MLFDLALAASILAFLHITLYFYLGYENLKHITNLFAVLAFLFNTASLIYRWHDIGHFPSSYMSDLFMLLCLSLSLTYIILYMIFKRPLLALFIFPVIMALGLFAKMMPTTGPSDVIIESVWLYIHLPFTILGTALFLFATISSIMYFVQEKQLKKKNFGFIFRRFPPLDVINSLTTSTLMTGFYFFSIGVFSGIIWMGYEHGRMGIFSPKMIFAIVTWFIFGTITYFKQFRGMTPRSTAYSTVAGFVSVVVTYIGVAIFLMG